MEIDKLYPEAVSEHRAAAPFSPIGQQQYARSGPQPELDGVQPAAVERGHQLAAHDPGESILAGDVWQGVAQRTLTVNTQAPDLARLDLASAVDRAVAFAMDRPA